MNLKFWFDKVCASMKVSVEIIQPTIYLFIALT